METRGDASEDHMVAAFLRAELASRRSGEHVRRGLAGERRSRELIDSPDLTVAADNAARARVLRYRGYRCGAFLFAGFPDVVNWRRAVLDGADLGRLRVLNQPMWVGYSGSSRLASSAASYLASEACREPVREDIAAIVARLNAGESLPEVILVGTSAEDLVILEGHARVMAAIAANARLTALVGTTPSMTCWSYY
jgi:hypothetical protein